MATTQPGTVLRRLRELVTAKDLLAAPDEQLLERFARGREEAAFAALVRRHGPLVLGVCRRVLHQEQDAEDVFQGTFLVLARKANSIGRRTSLGGWLYRVAFRMALRVRKQAAERRKREARLSRSGRGDPLAEVTGRELLAVFDEELQTLPERERVALVLCYLQGRTRDEAAREAGCSESTLKRRLERGKERMRARLARRGVVLPGALLAAGLAQGARAAVPGPLAAAAVEAGLLVAEGAATAAASARAVALADGALRAMTVSKFRTVGALLLVVTLLAAGTVLLAAAPPPAAPPSDPPPPPAQEPPKAPAAEAKPPADNGEKMTVAGQVRDADGKPFAGAEVAVLAERKIPARGGDLSGDGTRVLGRGKADADGRFRLEVPRTSAARFRNVTAVAGGMGHGIGWQDLNPDAEKPAAEIRLAREQVIRGRLDDLQGQPAAGVLVRVGSVGTRAPGEVQGVRAPADGKALPFWPAAAVTDKDGRFELRGIGRGVLVQFGVADDRFAAHGFAVTTDAKEGAKDFRAALEPPHIIEGTVAYADTGKPVPGARLMVYAAKSELDGWGGMDAKADDRGRFHVNPGPGNLFEITAYAGDGEPYLPLKTRLKWPKAAVKQQAELKLPRGVLVRGRVAVAGSDKALAGAGVQFIPRRANNPNFRRDVVTGWDTTVLSGADGRFDICVLPGPGHLLVHGPTPDFVYQEVGQRTLDLGKEGGWRRYAHAVVPVDLKPGAEPHDLAVTLKPGATVKGRVVGPDGKPVAEALMLTRLNVTTYSSEWSWVPLVARDGRFELHGCDPEKTVPVHFLDARNKAGATVEVSGKQAAEEVTVRLKPCGTATTRLVDGDGKPLPSTRLWLYLVVTPGAERLDTRAYDKGEPSADEEAVSNIDRVNHWDGPLTDADGRVTFPALIPGATYRVVEVEDGGTPVKSEFKAESGKDVKLPDVVRKKRPT